MTTTSDRIAAVVTPRAVAMLEAAGLVIEELTEEDSDRLTRLIFEEGANSMKAAMAARRRLKGHTHDEKVQATEAIVERICEIAVKRFIASMTPRHGPT